MSKLHLSEDKLEILNTKIGLKNIFSTGKLDIEKAVRNAKFEAKLKKQQVEMIKLQNWMIKNEERAIIIFEGRDAAGKGGAIRKITSHINPRYFRSIALPKPTHEEEGQWYFQRYVSRLPQPGEIVFFDRSWYNRAIVEPVNGFCTEKEYERFMGQVNEFERMIVESGAFLMKFYFSISKEEQVRRFEHIKSSPLTKWKMTPVDEKAQKLWDTYTEYKEKMFEKTDTKLCPWILIDANTGSKSTLDVTKHILKTIPYSS